MKLQHERAVRRTGHSVAPSGPRVCGPSVRVLQNTTARAQKRDTDTAPFWEEGLRKVASIGLAALTTGSLLLSPMPAEADTRVVRLPASSNPEIFSAQRTMVEAWTIVGESFVDPEFNHLDWPEELRQHMIAAYTSDQKPELAWTEINKLLSELGDPYTRRIEPEEYQAFRVSADGELHGIGLLIANELSSTGHLRVLAPIRGGPADRAGILPGDEVIQINGVDTTGWTGDRAAKILRGEGGTEVRVKLARRTEGIPGVPSRPEPPLEEPVYSEVDVSLRREAVVLSPVYGTLLPSPSGKTPPVGYVRLSQFSGNAAQEMKSTVQRLKGQGAQRFILDLRSNPGGLVKAGVDVAALWLDGEREVFSVASRDPGLQVQTTENRLPAVTNAPLVVLVDHMSASASEIVSGALHDNHRALLMGDSSTYGKGRIQSVFELQDGSALFVTVARYLTPAGKDIDHRGIRPDRSCVPGGLSPPPAPRVMERTQLLPARNALGAPIQQRVQRNLTQLPPPLLDNSPVQSSFMPGVPLDDSTEVLLLDSLARDRCVLAAAQYLDTLPPPAPSAPRIRLTNAQDLYLAFIQARGSL